MQSKKWTKLEVEYLINNYLNKTNNELAIHLNRSLKAVKSKLGKLSLKKNTTSEWSDEEILFLRENYEKLTNKDIGLKLGRTKSAVDTRASKIGLIKSKYIYNKDFFEDINTERKAYWLGFIYADGCVRFDEKANGGEVCIKLKWSDYEHLKNFNKDIEGNIEVKRVIKILNGKEYPQCHIRMYSEKMSKDLIDKGAFVNKTKIIDFNKTKVPKELMNHFIRGYFDGDGCVCKDSIKRKTIRADFTSGSLKFIEELRTFLFSEGISSYIYLDHENTYRLYIKGLNNYDKFYNYLYKDATIWLNRKKLKKEEIYEEYEIAKRLLR